MTKSSPRKHYYAIARGKVAPAVTQCWGVAGQLVSGFKGNVYKGFATFPEARKYLEGKSCQHFHFLEGPADGPKTTPTQPDAPTCYAVSQGKEEGIFFDYSTEAEPRVKSVSHANHKSFAAVADAEAYLEAAQMIRVQLGEDTKQPTDSGLSETSTYLEDFKEDDASDNASDNASIEARMGALTLNDPLIWLKLR
ncbi:hypothetical protein GQ53DRAFT_846324 [Thozetella sp. PMI_491]|nr:hypothetical protein GQ53DRAFT_846324 [Thozetella sp. PMI_491]